MKMHYRYGWPFGRLARKIGIPMLIRVEVIRDEEASVYVATSPDVLGLVVEASSIEDVINEVRVLIPEFFDDDCDRGSRAITDVYYKDRIAHA